jgi:hypothetical protein
LKGQESLTDPLSNGTGAGTGRLHAAFAMLLAVRAAASSTAVIAALSHDVTPELGARSEDSVVIMA